MGMFTPAIPFSALAVVHDGTVQLNNINLCSGQTHGSCLCLEVCAASECRCRC